MSEIVGVVEAIGTKWNGSVKMNGQWFSMKKGVATAGLEIGKAFTLRVEENTKDGKTYQNVLGFSKNSVPLSEKMENKSNGHARDYDKENRGKTKCVLLEALFSNPNMMNADADVKHLFELVDQGVRYVFGD